MFINNINNISKNDIVKKNKKTGGGDFAAHLKETGSTSSAVEVSSIAAVNPLFMLQEVDADETSAQQAINHGHDVLQILDDVKLSLLTGSISTQTLKSLDERIKNWRSDFNDPKLQEIIDEIELRAAVELAKLEN